MACHLTLAERHVLQELINNDVAKPRIAELMNRHASTIYRELRRNSGARGYRAAHAQHQAADRRQACRRPCKLGNLEVQLYVAERLKRAWSPDQIAGRARRDFPDEPARWMSAATIYSWIRRRGGRWRRWLRRSGRRRPLRRNPPDYVSIQGRPEVINRRLRYGDWEGDTVVGAGRRGGLLTLVERKSGLVRIGKMADFYSATAMHVAEQRLKDLPQRLRRSATFDNGKEFAQHRTLTERLGLAVYFAEPYRPWQRGSNENLNGLLRQFFPKGTDFNAVRPADAARAEQLLNDRPRKRLNYLTPNEILTSKMLRN
jgi:transposase, IS30 family